MKNIYAVILVFCSFTSIAQLINKYDGVYLVKSYTLRSGDPARTGYPAPFEMDLITLSPDSVQFGSYHLWADGSNVGVPGITFIIDSTTNAVTPYSNNGIYISAAPGYTNYYDAVAKIFYVSYTWTPGPSSRLINDTLIYLRPRSVLPLKLVSFKANVSGAEAHLIWTVVNEVAVKSYIVERSIDGRLYFPLGIVDAVNKSEAYYTFNDKLPSQGLNYYYRLKVIDINGSYQYSSVAMVNQPKELNVEIYPNPATKSIVVKHTPATNGATITIANMEGKLIKIINVQPGAVQTKILVDQLEKGNYIIGYNNNGERAILKFVKQ